MGMMKDVKLFKLNIFDLFNYTTANILLPLGGLLIVAFLGWFFPGHSVRDELSNEGTIPVRYFSLFRFIIRFIAPVAIALVFLNGLGLLKF